MRSGSALRHRVLLVAVVCMVVFAGCGGGGSGGGGAPDADGGDGPSGGDGTGGDGARGDGGGRNDGSGVGSFYDADGDRVVVRQSEMTLRVDDFDAAFEEIRALVREHDGYLGDRSQRGEGAWDSGTVVIRIPARSFASVRDALADLGRVESEQVSAEDFTREYDRRQERLEELRADERRLQSALNDTENTSDVETVREELESVRSRIAALEADQQSLERRATMSNITLHMHEPADRKPPENYVSLSGFGNTFLGSFYGGLGVLRWTVGLVGYLLPVTAGVGLLGVFAGAVLVTVRCTVRLAPIRVRPRTRWSRDADRGSTTGPVQGGGPADETSDVATGGREAGQPPDRPAGPEGGDDSGWNEVDSHGADGERDGNGPVDAPDDGSDPADRGDDPDGESENG